MTANPPAPRQPPAPSAPALAGALAPLALAALTLIAAACPSAHTPTRPHAPTAGDGRAAPARPAAAGNPPASREPPRHTPDAAQAKRLWRAAQGAAARGDALGEQLVLERLTRAAAESPQAHRARLRLAQEAAAQHAWGAARRWAAAPLPPALEPQRLRVYALASEGAQDYRAAARAWAALIRLAGDAPPPAEAVDGEARSLFLAGDPQAAVRAVRASAGVPAAPPTTPRTDAPATPGRGGQAVRPPAGAGRVPATPTPQGAGQAPSSKPAQPSAEPRRAASQDPSAARVMAAVEPALDGDALARLYKTLPARDPWAAWVALRFARERFRAGAMEEARRAADRAAGGGDPLTRREATEVLARLDAWADARPRRLGLLLPLSGRYQRIGQAALEAIQMALPTDGSVSLVVRDTKGDAQEAARAAEELVLDEHVTAILGPVGERETAAAAEAAARLHVPHLVLSSREELGPGSPTTFRLRVSPEELARALARYAYEALGIRRAAVLFPQKPSGERSMGAFWDEFVRLGGEIRAAQPYARDTKDFNAPVQALLAAPKPGRGVVDFEGLYLPDRALTVRRLVPFLRFWGLRVKTSPTLQGTPRHPVVQLLGGPGWNHASVVDRGEDLTDNAIFMAPFFVDPGDPLAVNFADRFQARYRKAPTAFHAEVRDAAAVVARALLSTDGAGPALREALRERLATTLGFPGVTGAVSVDGRGVLVRMPKLLTVDRDRLRLRRTEQEEVELRRHRDRSDQLEGQGPGVTPVGGGGPL